MVRPFLFLVVALVAGCTAPAYSCGHPVPCARGSVQSCTSRDGQRCRYRLSDGSAIECAACDDCFAAEREIVAWCASGSAAGGEGGEGGNRAPPGDLATDDPRDMSVGAGNPAPDLATGPVDLATGPVDLATAPADLATEPPGDLSSGPIDSDLGCYGFPYACNGDPGCCSHCCAGGCTTFGFCALQ